MGYLLRFGNGDIRAEGNKQIKIIGQAFADSLCTAKGASRHSQKRAKRHNNAVIVMTAKHFNGRPQSTRMDHHRIFCHRGSNTEFG